jgi:hypothetical protein
MPLLPCTKIYSALKRFLFIGTAAAVITAVISVILSLIVLLMLISFLNIVIVGVMILISAPINGTCSCDSCFLCCLAAAAWLRRADRHLVRTAASILVGVLVSPVKLSTGSTIARILRVAAAATAAYS